jgi:hypothetical protein
VSQCALWYKQYGDVYYMLCDSEEGAARTAVAMLKDGVASPTGVQFPDGRILPRDGWPAYADEKRRFEGAEDAQLASESARERPATRPVRDPFGGATLNVPVAEPAWLGRPNTGEMS